jgi:hypothetical protein
LLSVKLPKSFVAIDLSEKITDSSERRNSGKNKDGDEERLEDGDRGRSGERKEEHDLLVADESEIATPPSIAPEERVDGMHPAVLPSSALDA